MAKTVLAEAEQRLPRTGSADVHHALLRKEQGAFRMKLSACTTEVGQAVSQKNYESFWCCTRDPSPDPKESSEGTGRLA